MTAKAQYHTLDGQTGAGGFCLADKGWKRR
jgi:hypothetical protein